MKRILFVLISASILTLGCKENKKEVAPDQKALSEANETASVPAMAENVPSKVTISPIEHATAVLEWNNITVYIDPVGGIDMFKGHKSPDLILITDIHGDHFDLETLKALGTDKAKIIVPQAVADKIPDVFTPQIDVLNNGDSKERYGITIEAIPMYNLRKEALKFHEKGRGNGYLLSIDGQRIYFSGDTEDIPEMRSLKHIDKAFICMNLPYTMTPESAADAVLEFKPKQVYPYHYRGKPDVSDVSKFKQLVNAADPNIEVIQLDWYPKADY
ncbi:MBL fold metallo-hydrolase [Zobellia galactanivorans]|uniref:Metallo-beta-lactamase superfamily protein n=1 Tax=Zobellia galactanivorans (strain DSM 12802 / CCUG 47099 / CIP 106680 / NCIMB 13871 / Dsij) TaxID=63186 RepID=G0L7P1_ZOBGA|nr:MBL fold metallo-hydrolase [Zobellia galactanivorans]CAZ98172.1 Metallo-beta-lactamase superfamily protein [Zobellia galactanivorans]